MKITRILILFALGLILLNSCEKDPKIEQKYYDLLLQDDWQDFEVSENQEIIFKISIESETRIDLSWKEEPFMKNTDSFTGDIIVSAYRPDGITPYFEEKDNGYQDDSEMIEIVEGDTQVIIIIKSKEGKSGTFALRSRGITDVLVTNPKDIAFGSWVDKNCGVGDIKWLKVDCGSETDIAVEWMEFDRPETGSNYTADVKVSIYSEDLDVTYLDEQNHGFDTNARKFTLSHSSSILYIKVSLNDDALPGTYSIKLYPQQ